MPARPPPRSTRRPPPPPRGLSHLTRVAVALPPAGDAWAFLSSLEQHGIKLGLENIRTLCRALGDPQTAFTSVIVAGTNGKGSVTAMAATALSAAGIRTARYTSP